MARLSVNVNKIALLRNSRRTGVPDLVHFGRLALEAGAKGLTVHPRPDERHIRASDVPALAALMQSVRPTIEFNIEGFPDERLMRILGEIRPEQATLVPDAVAPAIRAIQAIGCRVILFIDPDPGVVDRVRQTGADGVEIYTGHFAAAFRDGDCASALAQIAATAIRARDAGLVVNAGHDLNLHNIPPLMRAVPFLAEASIGHELTADALETGFAAAVAAYARALA